MRLINANDIRYTRLLARRGLDMELVSKAAIDNMPTIDAEPVRHGRWEEVSGGRIICNNCGHYPLYDYFGRQRLSFYCWHCGAKMVLEG